MNDKLKAALGDEALSVLGRTGFTPAQVIDALTKHSAKLHRALQRIANLPLVKGQTKSDPNEKARKIAVIALGGDPRTLHHRKPK